MDANRVVFEATVGFLLCLTGIEALSVMGLALLAVGILSGLKAYMQSVGKTALQAILGAGTSEVVKELLTLVLRKG